MLPMIASPARGPSVSDLTITGLLHLRRAHFNMTKSLRGLQSFVFSKGVWDVRPDDAQFVLSKYDLIRRVRITC